MVNKKEAAQRHPADIPVTTLKGVGPAVAAKLERLNITTAEDLLFHLPFRYAVSYTHLTLPTNREV